MNPIAAAAPELLGVVERFLRAWDTGSDPDFTEHDIALREARAVLAKIRGQQQ